LEFEISDADIYPDYDLAASAPRLKMVKQDNLKISTVVTIIGVNRELVGEMDITDNGSISSSKNGVSISINNIIHGIDTDKLHVEASAVYSEAERTLILLRDSERATGIGGRTIMEMGEKPEFISAVIENGTANLTAAESFSPMRFSMAVSEIYLNGEPVSFRYKGDWIEIDREAMDGT
jgi:hypothetical protein